MDVTMPQLGETVTEGTITKWMKQIGDEVAVDETLFEVSTDKVDSEVPSPVAGVLTEIVINEGDTAQVGAKLAVISSAGAAPAPQNDVSSSSHPEQSSSSHPEQSEGSKDSSAAPQNDVSAAPQNDVSAAPQNDVSSSSHPEQSEGSKDSAPAPAPATDSNSKGKLLSPLVRKLVNDNGLDANQITGTGVGARITRDDVLKAISVKDSSAAPQNDASPARQNDASPARQNDASPAPATQPQSAPPSAPAPAQITKPSSGDSVVPFDNLRRRTAEHMVMSKATSPHAYITVEVDFENVERVRRLHGAEFKQREGFSLTYLPFIVRALSEVLPEFPHINASVDGDSLIVHHDFHVGIAVDLDFKGLLVPSVRNADGKRLRLIAQEIRDLAIRARAKQLRPDEIMGSTFTITNPGPMGTTTTLPIINQPQVAILATDGIKKKPVATTDELGTDVIAIHHVGNITLGWDHRAFDGNYTAAFLGRLREVLETRDWEAEIG